MTVFCVLKESSSIWAMKMLKKAEIIRLQQVEHIISEKDILSSLSHPFIVHMGGSFQGFSFLFFISFDDVCKSVSSYCCYVLPQFHIVD